MSVIQKLKRAVRGDVDPKTVLLEARRRAQVAQRARRERSNLVKLGSDMPRLRETYSSSKALRSHFRSRSEPKFFPGLSVVDPNSHRTHFPAETDQLLQHALRIATEHSWQLLGFGVRNFGREIEWRRDPLSGYQWPLDYHRDIQLIRNDGSDARVLWEINRFGHLVKLSLAYAISGDEHFSRECLVQLSSWVSQNPYGRGINWTCAMEAALRSMSLLTVFQTIRTCESFDSEALKLFLKLFHQHGTFIENNLEFSYLATSNHYLSDITGLLWLGIMLPEFEAASRWREFGLREMLAELDKQVLADGADFESSTSYHRLALELFLYTFLLCKENGLEIPTKYWDKLRSMLRYVRGYLRPDGLAPLIGDVDSAQVLPLSRRSANDHAYVLAIGATLLTAEELYPRKPNAFPEILWLLGEDAFQKFQKLKTDATHQSRAFRDAGLYVMQHRDLSLSINTSDAGLRGRGSHGHNDALSIELCIGDRVFIVDPGSYVYTADLHQRHLFRSTAYHSTVMVDGEEQNTTIQSVPFVIGNEASPRVLEWTVTPEFDRIIAEHSGYGRLPKPVIHRRTIVFYKGEQYWVIEDELFGEGSHECEVRFHFAPVLEVRLESTSATAFSADSNASLSIVSLDLENKPLLETQATSSDYGEKQDSMTVCWRASGELRKMRWELRPHVAYPGMT